MQEAAACAAAAHALKSSFSGEPLRRWLMATLMPTVTKALAVAAREQPVDPISLLASYLSAEADRVRV